MKVHIRNRYFRNLYTQRTIIDNPGVFYSDTGLQMFPTVQVANVEEFTDGGYIPGWRSRIAQHQNATTFFTGFRIIEISESAGATHVLTYDTQPYDGAPHVYSKTEGNFSGSVFGSSGNVPTGAISPSSPKADSIAQSKIIKKAWDAINSWQSGVFVGEIGKTIEGLKHPGKALRKGISDYSNAATKAARRSRGLSSATKAISDTWLEYVFHWTPLLRDINDAAKAAANLQRSAQFKYISATGTISDKPNLLDSLESVGNVTAYTFRRETTTASSKYYGEVSLRTGSQFVDNSRLFGLDLNSFIPTVWELIPYSFLVDYFSNIGDIISALSFPQSQLAWISSVHRVERTIQLGGRCEEFAQYARPYGTTTIKTGSPGSFKAKCVQFSRQPLSSLPIPSIRFEIPNTSRKWMNLGALSLSRSLPSKVLSTLLR